MAILRFVSTWLILFLLIGVILETIDERKDEPLIFLAHDNSQSIVMTRDSGIYRSAYLDQLSELSQSLSENYEVIEYSFSDAIESGISGRYEGKTTDISAVINSIFEQYGNRNIGAIILSTDGIYNTGLNPVYAVNQKSFIPVYTIGLGDTNQVRDLKVEQVNHNDVAFLGNEFPVEVAFSGVMTKGEKVALTIWQGSKQVAREEFLFTEDSYQGKVLFLLKAQGVGMQKYTAKITVIENEFSTQNNALDFYVEVIDGRQKIMIAQQFPHPDVSALRYVIDRNKNYQTEVKSIDEVTALNEYDLVIVHSYKAGNKLLDEAISEGSVPLLFINGVKTDMKNLQGLKVGFNGTGRSTEEMGFAHNTAFKDILLTPSMVNMAATAPPLHGPFGGITYSSALQVLAYQRVGNIQLNDPLIYFTSKGKSRIGVFTGEGIWRWRLNDQLRNSSTLNFEEFMSKVITYLAVKENRDPFRVNLLHEYFENQEVVIKAELYNKSFERINEPEVSFEFRDENGKEWNSVFMQTTDAYELNLGRLTPGLYTWKAQTSFQNARYEKSGTFLVKEVRLEWLNTVANHRLLRNISENTAGKFYFPSQINQIPEDLKANENLASVVYQEKNFRDLIDLKWLFVLILILVSAEWFFRKFNGAY